MTAAKIILETMEMNERKEQQKKYECIYNKRDRSTASSISFCMFSSEIAWFWINMKWTQMKSSEREKDNITSKHMWE